VIHLNKQLVKSLHMGIIGESVGAGNQTKKLQFSENLNGFISRTI